MSIAEIITWKQDAVIATRDALVDYINNALRRYEDTEHVTLDWDYPSEDEKTGLVNPMTLSQMVKRSQDARGMDLADKKGRKAEFDAVKAVFQYERISDAIEVFLRSQGFVPRFTGTSAKTGVSTMQFIRPDKAVKDAVGKKVKALEGNKTAQIQREALIDVFGEKVAKQLINGEITVAQAKAVLTE